MSGRTRVFLSACRVWLLVANGVAGAFAFGTAAFYVFIRQYVPLGSVIVMVVPPVFDFFSVTMVTLSIACLGHLLLHLRWLHAWIGRRRAKVTLHPLMPSHGLIANAKPRPVITKFRKWSVKYGPEIVRTRMLIEVAMQTFQANKVSRLIARQWINELMAVALLANCWFSLVVERLMRNQPHQLVRIVRLIIDSMLDIAYCIVIPLSIFYPYYRDFIGGTSNFPTLFFYTDAWYANTISEWRQVLMTSWTDCISKLVASLSMLYRMVVVDIAVTRAERHLPELNLIEGNKSRPAKQTRLVRILDGTLLVWGGLVAALYVHAAVVASRVSNVDCLLEMRPWGSTRYSCAVVEIDCIYQATLGDRATLQAAIEKADPLCVQVLVLSNCPRLEVPPSVQTLPNLVALKVYNSTIASWAKDAALRESLHPTLGQVLLPRVNMSEVPVGLLADDFPRTVWDIEISMTNLSTLPSQITQAWRGVRIFLWEGNPQLTSIPDALLALPSLWIFTVTSNAIATIRDDAFENCTAQVAVLDGNPLMQLPSSMQKLSFVSVADTLIAGLPVDWAASGPLTTAVRAGGTPLCGQSVNATIPEGVYLDCSPVEMSSSAYPIEQEDQWRERGNT